MQLISWRPVLKRNSRRPGYLFHVLFSVRCLACDKVVTFKTKAHAVPSDVPDADFQQTVDTCVEEATYLLTCKNCRTVKSFSSEDLAGLYQAVALRLTGAWVRSEMSRAAAS